MRRIGGAVHAALRQFLCTPRKVPPDVDAHGLFGLCPHPPQDFGLSWFVVRLHEDLLRGEQTV